MNHSYIDFDYITTGTSGSGSNTHSKYAANNKSYSSYRNGHNTSGKNKKHFINISPEKKAEEIAKTIASFPQECVRADRHSALNQHNLSVKEGLLYEWNNSMNNKILSKEGIRGAGRFSKGHGRHGNFEDI